MSGANVLGTPCDFALPEDKISIRAKVPPFFKFSIS